MRKTVWIALVLPVWVWSVINCSGGDSGAGGASGAGGSVADAADEAAMSWLSGPCGSCVAGACEAERTTCRSEPSCAVYLDCLEACPSGDAGNVSPECETSCPAPDAEAAVAAKKSLDACRQFGAGASCQDCGNDPFTHPLLEQNCAPSTQADECKKCLDESCCEAVEACLNSPDCTQTNSCWSACDDFDVPCKSACLQNEVGARTWLEFTFCGSHFCGSSCGLGGACSQCVKQNCLKTQILCETDPGCFSLGLCIANCPDGDVGCPAQCRSAASAASLDAFDAASLCRSYQCANEC